MSSTSTAASGDPVLNDLGPLAWVLDELRKSLDGATKAMHRFVRDAELARGSGLGELDASHLRVARQQLHQAVGALEMVGMAAPAKLLHAMESAVQKFVQHPEQCSDDAALRIERASFALTEFLEGVLKGKTASSVALFPQYRAVMELAGAERIHPADLWANEWRWLPIPQDPTQRPLHYAPEVRALMDQAVLKIVKAADAPAALKMAQVCTALAAGQKALESHSFWMIAAAYFEAMGHTLLPADIYTKRTASRILQQYATLAKGESTPSERLAQDLVFFCAQAQPAESLESGALVAIRAAYGLSDSVAVDYELAQFGRFDPAQLALARKRIATAAETWSALAGGDTSRLAAAAEQFGAVADSILKLHPQNRALAQTLTSVMEATARSGAAPSPEVAMEVATSVLYLEAAYEDLDPTDDQMVERSNRLAQRLQAVREGAEPEPLEAWMEELYRRVSDRQTMGSVVDELRTSLGEVETGLDQFFRNPLDLAPLRDVPSRLAQMRGVFSVLGLDQPALAALRMRASVDRLLIGDVDIAAARTGLFEKLGNSLGAMGLLIDMLSYQRAMAKKLFVYDEEAGELRPLMGRERTVVPEAAPVAVAETPPASESATLVEAAPAVPVQPVAQEEDDDEELREIFLEEAREVVANGEAALQQLMSDPANLADQTTVRRAFHTLKGSSRMVRLNEFGEAAWAFEQLLNAWLAEQKPASQDLLTLSTQAVAAFGRWIDDIANKADAPWSAAAFRAAADALRLDGALVPLKVPGWVEPEPEPVSQEPLAPEPAFAQDPLAPLEEQSEAAESEFMHTRSGEEIDSLLPDVELGIARPEFAATAVFDDPLHPGHEERQLPPELDFASTQMFETPASTPLPQDAVDSVSPDDFDLGNFDFDVSQPSAPEPVAHVQAPAPESEPEPEPATFDLDFPEQFEQVEPEPVPPAPVAPEPAVQEAVVAEQLVPEPVIDEPVVHAEPTMAHAEDEQTKVIGDLRLSIPLYNVYLNEADEWSRRLITELNEWSLELHKPLPQTAVMLAHSLGGSSATVGFTALAEVARTLEHALEHVRLHDQGNEEYARVFNEAAEDIRRLLHQFAAGFLKTADEAVLKELQDILATEFDATLIAEEFADSDDFDSQEMIETRASPLEPQIAVEAEAEAPAPQVAEPVVQDASLEPGIDAQDHLDADLFPIFQEEAAELLPALGTALRQWVARPENLSARAEALRVLHTLKGSARLAGALRLGEMAHRMESDVEALGTDDLQTSLLEPLLGRLDRLQNTLDALDLAPREDVSKAPPPAIGALLDPLAPEPQVVAPSVSGPAVPVEQVTRATPRSLPVQSVRVRAQLLDRLVNQAGEVMISRSRLDSRIVQMRSALTELTSNLDRLRQQLRDVEVQAESQMQSRLALTTDDSKGFDPLEFDRFTRVQELTRMMAESVNDVATVQRNMQRAVEGAEDDLMAQGRQARELQRDVLRTRMVEFEGISERLYGVVRQAAKETGKQVKLDIAGGNIEMDRGILDRMTPAFEHILRNAVAHGIESAEARHLAGKESMGNIHIRVHQEGNDVTVEFADDGGGLHLDKIRAKAVENGLIAADAQLSDQEAAKLLFAPGFSTAAQVTELSGRGIGMDVVLTELNALGGRVETQTETGKGTTFRLILPLTTAVTQVVLLRLGDFTIGVPANLMETVLRVPLSEVDAAYQQGSYSWNGQPIPFFWGGALLQGSGRSTDPQARNLPVAIFRSAGQRLALHVDEVLGNREVVVKNLGPQLAQLPGLAGMSMLASGAVVLIYNPVALATVYGAQANALSAAARAAPVDGAPTPVAIHAGEALAPLILVVDDSITVRRVTQRLLKREGFRVALANDGLHALEVLREEKPAVVLSDIEMPRMDGFELVRNIRADESLRDLPVIMITSRIAQKHRDHAVELGVDHCLGKPYAEDELLALIRSYCTDLVEV
ncbi:Hpt domain-containing protein [Rhodoferax sp. GW822-FHT02A01]|uniref:hybrid sensor histidine kinase/response regulator n=1 Tax=Rhodoferax sp. GW822-FHT02A01 TaxID=3141537 RepID=UPI00315C5B96